MASWRQAADAIVKVLQPVLSQPDVPPTKVFVGWPDPNQLLRDIRYPTGRNPPGAMVSIFPHAGAVSTARYTLVPDVFKHDASERVAVSGLTATITGTPTGGDNIFIYINGKHGFGASVKAESTFDSIAVDLSNTISSSSFGYGAIPSGPSLTVIPAPTAIASVSGRAFGYGDIFTEVGRITRRIMISVWAATPDDRANLEDIVIQNLDAAQFLTFADTSKGRILFDGAITHDTGMPANIFKGDVFYSVEYPVFIVDKAGRVGDIVITESVFGVTVTGGGYVFEVF